METGQQFCIWGKISVKVENAVYVRAIHLHMPTNKETSEDSVLACFSAGKMLWVFLSLPLDLERRETLFLLYMKEPQGSHISSMRCLRAL